jgi:hypothetical protein
MLAVTKRSSRQTVPKRQREMAGFRQATGPCQRPSKTDSRFRLSSRRPTPALHCRQAARRPGNQHEVTGARGLVSNSCALRRSVIRRPNSSPSRTRCSLMSIRCDAHASSCTPMSSTSHAQLCAMACKRSSRSSSVPCQRGSEVIGCCMHRLCHQFTARVVGLEADCGLSGI